MFDAQTFQHRLFSKALLPLWFCFLWICALPFLMIYRVGPLSSFYIEAVSLSGILLFLLLSSLSGRLKNRLPAAFFYFMLLAAFWWIQARVMDLTYPGISDMAAWSFLIIALGAWACRSWIEDFGHETVVSVFASALLIGAVLQAAVAIMQFTGWASADFLHGIVSYKGLREVNGQLGQRNHLGHYLMWGIMAAAYLWNIRRLPTAVGIALIAYLALALGFVNSRTIFAYLIGIGLLLPFWRLLSGKSGNRTVLTALFALSLVFVIQLGIGTLIDWFSETQYQTALARADSSAFSGSVRDIEGRKAWSLFMNAPLWGHGWGSYALQGFILHGESGGFTNNLLNVLFTHCHNLILQLLAEMGLAGTLVVGLGFLVAIRKLLMRPAHPAAFFLLAAMTVTLCHSMLEYPLWYVYFLSVFGLMIALSPSNNHSSWAVAKTHYAGAIVSVVLLTGLANLTHTYSQLTEYSSRPKSDTPADIALKIHGLNHIAENEPLLRYYAQLALTRRAEPSQETIQPWAQQAALEALTFRPYANAYQVGLYQYRNRQHQEAEAWLEKMYLYYPYTMPFYTSKIRSNPELHPLLSQIEKTCKQFNVLRPNSKPCL
ncbi:Wzy polymerase domain-containing protein [Neisseria weaveri]|uniref:Wzy polymerase domain-containing protein n=1 Tax=Neisseria weaveri TaxID=28091 RepID=UPI0007C9CE7B|nr:Wzy polymerase domain-containing protein [Neisseria weaveri]SAY50188.1 integral membrane protein [Neisseria weaveri]